jgi:hypothetical protein
MCEGAVRSGSRIGVPGIESSAGVMSLAQMAGIGCLILAQKLLPPRAAIDCRWRWRSRRERRS